MADPSKNKKIVCITLYFKMSIKLTLHEFLLQMLRWSDVEMDQSVLEISVVDITLWVYTKTMIIILFNLNE